MSRSELRRERRDKRTGNKGWYLKYACYALHFSPSVDRRITALGQWNAWQECSVTCGTGTRMRTRVYKETPDDGTKEDCPGSECTGVETEPCVMPKCCVPGVAGPELPFCYKVNETRLLNWNESREMAGRRGPTIDGFGKTRPTDDQLRKWLDGELVSIHSEHENEFVRNLIRNYGGGQYWIGLRCLGGGPNSCYWSDGSRVDYLALPLQFLSDGEPKCASISSRGPLWQLSSCSNELYFVSKSWNVSSSVCGPTPNPSPSPCYEAQTSTDKQTWDGAAKTVQLATIQSQQEMDHITNVVLNDAEQHMPFWVGLTCSKKWPDVCYWVDGSSLSYRRGLDGERDFVCGAVTKAGEFFFKDCNEKLSYIEESEPRCDKIGFPDWTAYSYECYNNSGSGQCGREASGVHVRLRWTRYPDQPGCPTEPQKLQNETQPCILPCPVTSDTDIVVGPAEKATARVERKCDWFRLVDGKDIDTMTEDEQFASLRGSEDYWLMYQLFYDVVDVREFNKDFSHDFGVSKRARNGDDRGKILKWSRKDCRHYTRESNKESLEFGGGILNPCLEPGVKSGEYTEGYEAMGRCFDIKDVKAIDIPLMEYYPWKNWRDAQIDCGDRGGYLATLGRNERDRLIVRYMKTHPYLFREHKVFIGLRRESDQWYWFGADGVKTAANATEISFEEDPNQTSELCGMIDFEKVEDEPQTNYVDTWACDKHLLWICAWDPPEYVVNVEKKEDWSIVNKQLAVENKRDWRRCRCEQFEGSDVVDVPHCYKVGDHKTDYQDIVVGQQINVIDGSAEMMDLVTIFNHVEQKQVETVIQKDFEKHIEEQEYEFDDPCQSVYTDHPSFSHNKRCFVLHMDRTQQNLVKFNQSDAIYKCDQGPDGRLADYSDTDVRDALQKQLGGDWANFVGDNLLWSDLYAVRKEGDQSIWQWADGRLESSSSSFWQEGKPDDGGDVDLQHECAVANSADGYNLTTQACKIRRKFVCHSKKTLTGIDKKESLNHFCSSSSKTEWKVLSLEQDCLVMPNHEATFQEAQHFCEGYKSGLAILDREDFYEQLRKEWKRLGDDRSVGSDLAYVGLKLEDHNWKWKPLPDQEQEEPQADQEPFSIPWSDGSPQRMLSFMTGGLCAVADKKHDLKMKPEKCANQHAIICQYSPEDRVVHYWMGLFCEIAGDPRTCHWGDDTTVSLYHPFSMPDFERTKRLGSSDYNCVAIRAHRGGSGEFTYDWVPRKCSMKSPAVLEYFRSCHKWEFEGSGFGAADRKKGWSSCPLVTGLSNALLGQCGTSTGPLQIFTAYELTFCMAFAGTINDDCVARGDPFEALKCSQSRGKTWYQWRDSGEGMLVELGSQVEYEYVARRLIDEGRGDVFSHIGAICQKTEEDTATTVWYSCKWYKSGSTLGLDRDSPYWMYKGEVTPIWTKLKGETFTEPEELCVAIYPQGSIEGGGMLVTVLCDDELYNSTAVLQFDKHYYDSKGRPTTSSNFPEFLEEFPDVVEEMDRPAVFYLTNAQDATQ